MEASYTERVGAHPVVVAAVELAQPGAYSMTRACSCISAALRHAPISARTPGWRRCTT